jgi:hypothetical protein
MRKILSIFFLASIISISGLHSYAKAIEIGDISKDSREIIIDEREFLESQIQELKDQYNRYKDRAVRLQQMGDRLNSQGLDDAAKARWEEARQYKQMANDCKIEIKKLEKQIEEVEYQIQNQG